MTSLTEAQLASRLSDALSDLHQLEAFRTEEQTELQINWTDRTASNTGPAMMAMRQAVLEIVMDNLQDLFATAVARKREAVAAARTALLDFVFKAPQARVQVSIGTPPPAPQPTPIPAFKTSDWVQTAPDAPAMQILLIVDQDGYREALCQSREASSWYDTRTLMLVPEGTMVPNDAGATAEPAVENLDEVF